MTGIFHAVVSAAPLPGLRLLVRFSGGQEKEYSLRPLLDRFPVFQALRDVPGLFDQVRTDPGGYGISWNDDLDLSCEELWANGHPVSPSTR